MSILLRRFGISVVSRRIAPATTSILLPSTRRILSRSSFFGEKRLIALTRNTEYVLRMRGRVPKQKSVPILFLAMQERRRSGPRFMSPCFLFLCRCYKADRPFPPFPRTYPTYFRVGVRAFMDIHLSFVASGAQHVRVRRSV